MQSLVTIIVEKHKNQRTQANQIEISEMANTKTMKSTPKRSFNVDPSSSLEIGNTMFVPQSEIEFKENLKKVFELIIDQSISLS